MATKKGPILLAAGVGLLALLFGGKAKAATKPPACDLGPFRFDSDQVQGLIGAAITAGMRDDVRICTAVARGLWAKHPQTDAPMVWPPPPSADAYQLCAWSQLQVQLEIFKTANDIPPFPPCPDGSELEDGVCKPDGLTPVDLTPWLNNDPTWPLPGTFYQVVSGDIFLGQNPGDAHSIVYSTLLSAAYHAAITVGGATADEAKDFAQHVAFSDNLRLDYYTLILCSPWNDALYGTYGYGDNIGSFDSPMNRAIRLLPSHPDNFARISAGRSPARNISMGDASNPGDGSGKPIKSGERNLELLWLPAINLQILWDSKGLQITTEGMEWEDGTTKLMPPPIVADLAADRVPPGTWGCTGFELVPTSGL